LLALGKAFFMRLIYTLLFLLIILSCETQNETTETAESGQDTTEKTLLWTASFSHNGRYLAVGGDHQLLEITDLVEQVNLSQITGMTACAAWHPTKSILATVGWEGESDGHNHLFNFEPSDDSLNLEEAMEKIETPLPIPGGARHIAWNHDGSLLASANNDGSVSIMNEDAELLRTITWPNAKSNTSIDWLSGKNYFMVLSDSMRMYDTAGTRIWERAHRDQQPGFSLLLSIAWHPSGRYFALGDYGNEEKGVKPLLQFWSTEGELTRTIEGHEAEIRNMVWSPDGSKLATASDALRIFSDNGELLHTGESEHKLWGIDWHADSIVTSSEAGEVIFWNEHAERLD
jgi:WD40 repeat protein